MRLALPSFPTIAVTVFAVGSGCLLLGSAAADSLYDDSVVPDQAAVSDPNAVELGLRFVPGQDGVVSAVRFYRGDQGDGQFQVNLYDAASGAKLGQGNTYEGLPATLPGWAEIPLASPVDVLAGEAYTASYYHAGGNYAISTEAFARPLYRGQLFAEVDAGVYRYGSGGGFPDATYLSASYFVDVVFAPAGEPPASSIRAPTVFSVDPVDPGAFNVRFSPSSIGYGEVPRFAARHFFYVDGAFAGVVPFPQAQAGPTRLLQGDGGFGGGGGSRTVQVRGQASDGTYSPLSTARSVVLPAPRGLEDDPFSLIYPHGDANYELGDGTPSEYGQGFRCAVDAEVTAVRFYKGSLSQGPFVGSLWTADGQLLGTTAPAAELVDFGWRELPFAAAVPIVAGQDYVVSYFAPTGYPAYSPNFFSPGDIDYFPLKSTTAGLVRPGSAGFPDQADSADSSFFVDVAISPAATTTVAPTDEDDDLDNSVTLFGDDYAPAMPAFTGDTSRVELGLRVQPLVAGQVVAIRFFRGVADPDGHTVSLWAADGTLLASAATATTATGWNEVPISPFTVAAGTTYIASYLAPNGAYAATYEVFAGTDGIGNDFLRAPGAGGNGVYTYGGGFPTSTYRATDYGVDVVFVPVVVVQVA